MTDDVLTNDDAMETHFAVLVNGEVKQVFPEKILAEAMLTQLPEEERAAATVVPMTKDGKQVLFG